MTVAETLDRTRLVGLPWGRMFVSDTGPTDAAMPLVLLHGLLVTHYAFREVAPALATDRRVLAVDLPGCGESDRPAPASVEHYAAPWLAAQIDALLGACTLSKVDVLGHSFGGTVALWLAATVPERIRRLVLVDPVVYPFALPLAGRIALLPRVGPVLFESLYRQADLRRYLRGTVSTPELLDSVAVDVYWDRLGRAGGREAAHAMLEGLRRLDPLHTRLGDVQAPTLVVWGDRDRMLPVADGERLCEQLVDARLSIVPGCGHAVPEERPAALVELVRGFLDA